MDIFIKEYNAKLRLQSLLRKRMENVILVRLIQVISIYWVMQMLYMIVV